MNYKILSTALALLASGATSALATVKLASPFTDHMVLQRGQPVPVWGTTANAGDPVTVRFAGQTQGTTADADGRWKIELAPLAAGGPFELTVETTDERVRLEDVLVGEVWLASGQSNMDFTVAKTPKYYFAGVNNEAAAVAAANYPQIRMFTGEWARTSDPRTAVGGTWKVCTPENVREFSAIGYFFARDLQQALHVPVGIVTLTYGASTAQAWIRREAIAADPRVAPAIGGLRRQGARLCAGDRRGASRNGSSRPPRPWRRSGARRGGRAPIPRRTSSTIPPCSITA